MRTRGEAGVVQIENEDSSKLIENAPTCMFVGYALNHEGKIYRIWNLATKGAHVSRGIIMLKRMCFENTTPRGNCTSKNLLTTETGETKNSRTTNRMFQV